MGPMRCRGTRPICRRTSSGGSRRSRSCRPGLGWMPRAARCCWGWSAVFITGGRGRRSDICRPIRRIGIITTGWSGMERCRDSFAGFWGGVSPWPSTSLRLNGVWGFWPPYQHPFRLSEVEAHAARSEARFPINPRDIPAPFAMITVEQHLRGHLARTDDLAQRVEEAGLVIPAPLSRARAAGPHGRCRAPRPRYRVDAHRPAAARPAPARVPHRASSAAHRATSP